MRGYYSLIQYCPDRGRAEATNIGMFLFCPEEKYLKVKMASNNDRVKRFFGAKSFDEDRLNSAKKAMQNRLEDAEFKTLGGYQEFIESRANEIIFTDLHPVKVFDLEDDFINLFQELVGDYD